MNKHGCLNIHVPVMNDQMDSRCDDILLARSAAEGNEAARKKVTELVDDLINRKNSALCREHCYENCKYYACTIDRRWGNREYGAPLCENGNASYWWMLEDLTGVNRLLSYEGRNGASLLGYLTKIADSREFLGRWRDWRFKRRVRVPAYIDVLDEDADRLFRWMVDRDEVPNMAQRLDRDEDEIREIWERIVVELTKKRRLHLLDGTREVSMTSLGRPGDANDEYDGSEYEIPHYDVPMEDLQLREIVREAWKKLNYIEQFVLEAMGIDELTAKETLRALTEEGLSVKDGVPPENLKLQDIYYFYRKTVSKLASFTGLL